MGEAYRTWIILLHQSTVCMRGATCFLIHQDVKAKASNLSLRLFLNCSYFSSDFSLNVLSTFVLIKKKRVYAQARLFRHLANQHNCWSRFAFLKKHQIPSRSSEESFSGNSVKISDCRAFSLRI